MVQLTKIRYARFGIPVDDWREEPAFILMRSMGWEELDERGERFAAYARAILENPSISAVQVVTPRGKVRTEYRREKKRFEK